MMKQITSKLEWLTYLDNAHHCRFDTEGSRASYAFSPEAAQAAIQHDVEKQRAELQALLAQLAEVEVTLNVG